MPRTKQVMKYIEDDKKRNTTYRNRLFSLVQKTAQLGVLCDIDILLIALKPGSAGARGERTITWPIRRGDVQKLITRFRKTVPKTIKENLNIGTYLQGELGKEERRLVKVRQCRLHDVLPLWDPHLDELPLDDIISLHDSICEKLKVIGRRRTAEVSSVDDVPTSSAVTVTAPALQHQPAPAFLGNDFDLNSSDAGSSSVGAQDHYYNLPPEILPQLQPQPQPQPQPQLVHVQSPYVGLPFHMHPSCIAYGGSLYMRVPMAAPPALAAVPPAGYNFTGGGINFMEYPQLPAATTGFYDEFSMHGSGQGSASGALVAYNQEFLANRFDAAAGTGAGYDVIPRAAEVWPLGTSYPVDAAALQMVQNETVMWPDNVNGVGHYALGEQEERSWLRQFHGRM